MASEKAILKTIPILQSATLLERIRKRKGKPVKSAIDAIIGTSLIKETANAIDY